MSTLSTLKHGGDIIKRRKTCTILLALCMSICILPSVEGSENQIASDETLKHEMFGGAEIHGISSDAKIGLNEIKNVLEVNAAYNVKVKSKVRYKSWYKYWYKSWYKYWYKSWYKYWYKSWYSGKWRYKWKYKWKYRWKYKYVYKNKAVSKPKKANKSVKVPSKSTKAVSANNQTEISCNQTITNNKTSIKKMRRVYIASDNIYSKKRDMKLVNAIVKALKKKGIYAVNYGIGPNKHISVLKDKQVSKNALVVNIYGGACALTLWEMGTKYYKKIKGKRKVFTVMYPPAKKITGLAWLKKAHDDNSGIISGLKCPDKYLLKRGYHYIETGNLNSIVSNIYKEAVLKSNYT